MWLSWLGVISQGEESLDRFPGTCLRCGPGPQLGHHERGNWSMFLSHIVVSLPLFLPPCPLYKNKQIKSLKIYFKKFHVLRIEQIGISFSFSGAWLFKPLCPSESAWGLSKNYRFSVTSRTRPPQKEGSNICIDSSSWSSLVKKHSAIVFYKICI